MTTIERSKNTPPDITCDWCGKEIANKGSNGYLTGVTTGVRGWLVDPPYVCHSCALVALDALQLAKEVKQLVRKGGIQLYIAVERTGQKRELLSAKRWSPLESLGNADSAGKNLSTYQLPQE